jgi:hypothetical protein
MMSFRGNIKKGKKEGNRGKKKKEEKRKEKEQMGSKRVKLRRIGKS